MKITIPASKSNTKTILSILEDMGYSLPCNCHGQHCCGGDRYSFDCSMVPHDKITIELPSMSLSDTAIQGITWTGKTSSGPADTLLIDLGTTTIAMVLMQSGSGAVRQTSLSANPQKKWGTDVIARIHSACQGNLTLLKETVTNTIRQQAEILCARNRQDMSALRFCYIGGNTTMIHLLMGFDCTPLSASPFTPEVPNPAPFYYGSCRIVILPWMSAFVGGDITAGLFACQIPEEDTSALIDLGTNGEIVLAHKGICRTAATAAGPAFEGGGLSCGCASIPGAITSVSLRAIRPILTTIDNKIPVGICGSGALSLCAELLRNGYVDKEGILTSRFPEQGIFLGNAANGTPLHFTPEDFRNIQMAVAAIAAGLETLCHEADITCADISRLYLSGGFGSHLSLDDCQILELLSSVERSCIQISGNTCLAGLFRYALEPGRQTKAPDAKFVELSENTYFKDRFLQHMTYKNL